MTQTRVLFARHSAAHKGSSLRLRPLHSHLPPHDLSKSRKDLLFSECSQNCSLHVHLNLSLSSDKTSTVAGTPLGELPVGGWTAAEAGVNVAARGDKVDSMRGAVSDGLGMDAGVAGDKIGGCAVRWRSVAGIKVVAVGDRVESMGVGAVSSADGGAGCVDCA